MQVDGRRPLFATVAAAFPDVGIGLLGVSLAFGLAVLTVCIKNLPFLHSNNKLID